MLLVRQQILSKLLKAKFNLGNKENKLVELNLHEGKWLIICIYNPSKIGISSYQKSVIKESLTVVMT